MSVNESSTRLHAWHISRWLVRHLHSLHSRGHPTRYGQWSPAATFSRSQDMPHTTDALQLRRSKLQCCRPPRVEQFTAAPATRHELYAFQASTENISIRELVNHGALLWLFAYFCALQILLLTYLPKILFCIYLVTSNIVDRSDLLYLVTSDFRRKQDFR